MAFGMVVVIVGTLLLLDSLDVIPEVTVTEIWAAALIGFGVMIVFRGVRRSWRRR